MFGKHHVFSQQHNTLTSYFRFSCSKKHEEEFYYEEVEQEVDMMTQSLGDMRTTSPPNQMASSPLAPNSRLRSVLASSPLAGPAPSGDHDYQKKVSLNTCFSGSSNTIVSAELKTYALLQVLMTIVFL